MHIVAGQFKNHRIVAPKGEHTRPTTERLRESLFNICQHEIADACVLDLFAGSGAIGLEALSRGAAHAVFVDNNREAIKCIRQNIESLHLESKSTVLFRDVFSVINQLIKQQQQFQIIYADPPYDPHQKEGYVAQLLKKLDDEDLLVSQGMLFIEEEARIAFDQEEFQRLKWIDSRRSGKATLHRFQRM